MFVASLMRHLTPFVFIAYTWNTSGTCTFITFIRYTSSPPTKKCRKRWSSKCFPQNSQMRILWMELSWTAHPKKRDFSPGISNLFETTSLIKVFKDVEFVGTLMYLFFFCV